MLIFHKGHTDTIQVYSVTVMTHVKALQAGYSSQGTSEPITPAIPVKSPTRKYAPGRVHGKNPQKCAHGPVFCTSEVTHAGIVPNNPPMGQLLGENMVSITCVINILSGTWRSNEGATYYFTKYCCVK